MPRADSNSEFELTADEPRMLTLGEISLFHFYEKVIKVKADVAALHIVFLRHRRRCVRWRGELSRAPFFGVHLDP